MMTSLAPRTPARLRRAAFCVFLLSCAANARAGNWITPEFSLTMQDLGKMTVLLPADIRQGIIARPSVFLDL
ncbi:MAG: hypothetical protein ABSG17_19775 [Spirochaetia bacterium]|jgi:hypothetical protein